MEEGGFLRRFARAHPRLCTWLALNLVVLAIATFRYLAIDRYDAAKYRQFELHSNVEDRGVYYTPEDLAKPFNNETFYGGSILLNVRLGAPSEHDGHIWYPDAETPDLKMRCQFYSDEPLDESLLSEEALADCLFAGYYSVPTGQDITVARGGFILRVKTLNAKPA